ncbi:phospholipase [Streptomyces sp. AP-93]|uniref:phospholipase n=1 Tax=Streptomyces sp. AP-93 TaxID=2929048 RepID=UPI001FAE8D67|nr:phospholipase [Streptomyces sp. AP-93]MCJ0875270.1 phospholipase [Streptomyces sp. AP-93]
MGGARIVRRVFGVVLVLMAVLGVAGVVGGGQLVPSSASADERPARYLVDTFKAMPGYKAPGQGAVTGTLNAGTNYVFCKVRGPEVREGSEFNHFWLKTDLDSGSPSKDQFVSAFALSKWNNDEAKDNTGREIPDCAGTTPSTPTSPSTGGGGNNDRLATVNACGNYTGYELQFRGGSLTSRQVMDVYNAGSMPGSALIASQLGAQNNQFFRLVGPLDAALGCAYELHPVHVASTPDTSTCVQAGATGDGAPIELGVCSSAAQQRFYLQRRGDAVTLVPTGSPNLAVSRTSDGSGKALVLRPASAHAHQTWYVSTDNSKMRKIADHYLYDTPADKFAKLRADKPYDRMLTWGSDQCSSPTGDRPNGYDFGPSCERHDFGYRNYRKQNRLNGPDGDTLDGNESGRNRERVDNNFLDDMMSVCRNLSSTEILARHSGGTCPEWANTYYSAVRAKGYGPSTDNPGPSSFRW